MSTPRAAKPPICAPPPCSKEADRDSLANASARNPNRGALLHWTFLILAIAVAVASFVLRVENRSQVIVPLINQPLPGTCTFFRLTGVPCPGCGLTRSFISFAHGQWIESWRYNPAGVFFFAVVAFQIPYRLVQIVRVRRGMTEHRFAMMDAWVLVGLAVALLVQWVMSGVARLV